MTAEQRRLLNKLAASMWGLSFECEHDEEFNQLLAKLNIFNGSIDEVAFDLVATIEEE